MDMHRLRIPIALLLIGLAGFPALAAAQSNSGLDAYTENPPGTTPTDSSSGGSTGTGTATGTGTEAGTGVAGTGSANGSAAGLTEAQAAAAGTTPEGQLPATGLDETVALAAIGALLLASGFAVLRFARRSPA
jgi:LPXTG-motif cell wall-anchored protein